MPKPTFMQSVLRKPTRSYADPYATSPWADSSPDNNQYEPPQSRYAMQMDDGVHMGYRQRDGPNDAGPSRLMERKTQSVVSVSRSTVGTRFPAPRKAMSTAVLRDEAREGLGGSESGRAENVKKKKKPRSIAGSTMSVDRPASPLSTAPSRSGTARRPAQTRLASVASDRSLTPPSSLQLPSERGSSSAASSSMAPASPRKTRIPQLSTPEGARPALNVVQKALVSRVVPPLSPPNSERSSEQSINHLYISNKPNSVPVQEAASIPPPRTPKSPKRLSVSSLGAPSDAEEEAFYTPRTSMNVSLPVTGSASESMSNQQAANMVLPSLYFQPPTPAALSDAEDSPFYSEPTSTVSLQPDTPFTPRNVLGPVIVVKSPTPSPAPQRYTAEPDEDAQSDTGEVGSDDDEEAERQHSAENSRQNSFSRPRPVSAAGSHSPSNSQSGTRSRPVSRPPSVALSAGDLMRPESRASTRLGSQRNAFDDFVVRRRGSAAASEASFAPEGSVRSNGTGVGKGGWAAAASIRSGAATPTRMFMPTGGNDGWADFQPPPRQSRFTPLPAAFRPRTFNNIVHGTSGTPGGSALSSYSQESSSEEEDETLPKASRSYAKRTYASESGYSETPSQSQLSMPLTEDRYLGSLQQRQANLGFSVDPYAIPDMPVTGSMPDMPAYIPSPSRNGSMLRQGLSQRRSYTPPSITTPYDSRPSSPNPSRPSSRMGFDPPAFLNPDTLTLLPEMTEEDSAKTYVPSEPSRPSRRPASVFGTRSRGGRSEVDYTEERDDVAVLPPRSKSVMGLREKSSRWEGSSAGDGVLTESHGRGSEHVTGYSNLVLPLGAYNPKNSPTSSPNVLDPRILGMPHSTMAAIVLSTLPHRDTPQHLRDLSIPLDFTSHIRPPTKVGDSQVLVQVYATAIDEADMRYLDEKHRGDIGKWVPGRSFVGRCLAAGADEKEIVRGEIVVGIMELKKSGALAEYIICDRRRIARAPYPTNLTLEQLALLPLQGIAAARAVRTHLTRQSRALIMGAHEGIPALICQEMSRAGVSVTAVIPGGTDSHEAQSACMANGARGVLTGSAAGVMLALDEYGWDFVFDTQGGQRVYDAAKRMLKNGATLVTLVDPSSISTSVLPTHSRSSGFKTLRAAFGSKKKETKSIVFEYLPPTGSGEPAVDSSGVDCRDVLEEACMSTFRPVVNCVVPLEKGAEVFKTMSGGVVRLVN